MLFTDYRTTSNESMLAKHSHLLPIQPSRASSLLPSLLGGTCSQTRWVTPTISTAIIDFLPINQARLNFYRFCPYTANLVECSYAGFFSHLYIKKINRTISLNQHHIHLICGSQYPLKWTEPVQILSCVIIVDGCKAELPSKKNILEGNLPLQHIFKREKLQIPSPILGGTLTCTSTFWTAEAPIHPPQTMALAQP